LTFQTKSQLHSVVDAQQHMKTSMDVCDNPSVPRILGQYEPQFQPFLLHTKNYVVQYNQLYLQRLNLMKPHMRDRARCKWGANIPVLEKIIDLQEDGTSNEDAVLIGMLSKDLKLRGSVIMSHYSLPVETLANIYGW
jgi:hypothetical protein